jgi:hypothetical protein
VIQLEVSDSIISEQLLHVLHASSDRDFDTVFETVAQLKAGALVIGADSFLISRSELAALGVHHAVPAVFENREFVVAGGLMGYGGSFTESYRLAGNPAGFSRATSPPICRSSRELRSRCTST